MASVSPIKFRCFRCQKLLGVSRSKVGTVVACPQCAAELIVPEPADAAPTVPTTPSASSSDIKRISASQVEPGVVPWDRPPEPESGLQFPAVVTEPLTLRPDPPAYFKTNSRPAVETKPRPAPAPPLPEPAPLPQIQTVPASEAVSFPIIAPEPASIRDEPVARLAPSLSRDVSPRRNDVILPRTAVVLGSFLVLLGMVFAFATGLLLGRFVWAPGVRVASPMAPVVEPAR